MPITTDSSISPSILSGIKDIKNKVPGAGNVQTAIKTAETANTEALKTKVKNNLIKAKVYNDSFENMIAINKEYGISNVPEVTDYIKQKQKVVAPILAEHNKLFTEDKQLDVSPMLFGGPTFMVADSAVTAAFNVVYEAIPEEKRSEYPILSNLLAIGATIAGGAAAKKGIETLGNADFMTAVNTAAKTPSVETEIANLVASGVDPKVLSDLGFTVPQTQYGQPVKTVGASSKNVIQFDNEASLVDTSVVTLHTDTKFEKEAAIIADDLASKAKQEEITAGKLAAQESLTQQKQIVVPTNIDDSADAVAEVVYKTKPTQQEALIENIRTFKVDKPTAVTDSTYRSDKKLAQQVNRIDSKVLEGKLKSIEHTVATHGYDKSISKFIADGDIDAALLRADEIKANRASTGIQRPGSPDYRPLSNEFVYAHAVPEIVGGLLGVSIEYTNQLSEGGVISEDRLAAAFLIGAGGTAGARYLWSTVTKVDNAGVKITEEVNPNRLETLRAVRVQEIDDILTELSKDIETAAPQRKAKLIQTAATLSNIKNIIGNTKDLKTLINTISPESVSAAMSKAGRTVIEVPKPAAASVSNIAGQMTGTIPNPVKTTVNLKNIHNADELENVFSAVESTYKSEFKAKPVTLQETEALAEEMGFTVKELNTLYGNTTDLHARLLAARTFRDTLGTDILRLAKEIDEIAAMKGDVADLAIEMQNKMAQFSAVHSMVKKSGSEIARALSAMRITSKAKDSFEFISNTEILANLGSGSLEGIKKAAKILSKKVSLEAHDHQFIHSMLQPNAMNMVEEFYMNALLSNPKTHMANALANTFTGIHSIFNKYAEVGVSILSKDGTTLKEANAYAYGYLSSIKEAFNIARMASKKGEPILDWLQKEDGVMYQSISKETLPGLGEFGNHLGTIVNTPFKALMVSDEFFKVLSYRAEFNSAAVRTALNEGLKGEQLALRIADLQANATTDIIKQAMDHELDGALLAIHRKSLENARFNTFNTQLGELGVGIQKLHNLPGVKLIFPFIKTPINILKYIGKHTPGINLLSEGERANLAAGGRARAKVLGRLATGSALYSLGWMLASDGTITGKLSSNPGEVNSMKAGGIMPDSIKIGDKYISYTGLDTPFSFFKIMADMHTALEKMDFKDTSLLEEATEIGSALTITFGQLAENSTWMKSFSDIINLMQEPKNPSTTASDKLGDFAANKLASFIPAMVYGLSKEENNIMREARTMVDKFMSKIPGLSDELPIQYDMYGQPKHHTTGLYPKAIEVSTDPVKQEVARLKYNSGFISKKMSGVEIPPVVYSFITQEKGKSFYSLVHQAINQPNWKNLNDGTPGIPGGKEILLKKYEGIAETIAIQKAKDKFPDFGKQLNDRNNELIKIKWGKENK